MLRTYLLTQSIIIIKIINVSTKKKSFSTPQAMAFHPGTQLCEIMQANPTEIFSISL